MVRLDSMTGHFSRHDRQKLTEENLQIAKKEDRDPLVFSTIKNATAAELAKAREMIAQLNDKIGSNGTGCGPT